MQVSLLSIRRLHGAHTTPVMPCRGISFILRIRAISAAERRRDHANIFLFVLAIHIKLLSRLLGCLLLFPSFLPSFLPSLLYCLSFSLPLLHSLSFSQAFLNPSSTPLYLSLLPSSMFLTILSDLQYEIYLSSTMIHLMLLGFQC